MNNKHHNKIKLQVAPQILGTMRGTAEEAPRLGWEVPMLQPWSALIKVTWASVYWITPLKQSLQVYCRVKLFVSINRSVDICTAITSNIYKGWDQEEKNSRFRRAWRLAQRALLNCRNRRVSWLRWQGPLLPRGLTSSSGPHAAESHCEIAHCHSRTI